MSVRVKDICAVPVLPTIVSCLAVLSFFYSGATLDIKTPLNPRQSRRRWRSLSVRRYEARRVAAAQGGRVSRPYNCDKTDGARAANRGSCREVRLS
jgi:hypothetical protein